MKIYKQNGDILELKVSEYKELFGEEVIKINTPRHSLSKEYIWPKPLEDSATISTTSIPTYTKSTQIKYPDIPAEGYMSTSTK